MQKNEERINNDIKKRKNGKRNVLKKENTENCQKRRKKK